MPWHITSKTNLQSILTDGLVPAIGPRSVLVDEQAPKVHLFSTLSDLESADWIEDEIDLDDPHVVLHVAVPAQHGAWTEIAETIPPSNVMIIGDLDEFRSRSAYAALDRVTDPFASLEDFRATKVITTPEEFGHIVGDGAFLSDDFDEGTRIHVYAAGYFIEEAADGEFHLTLENDGWSSRTTSVEEMERLLFEFSRDQRQPADQSAAPEL